jgi:hypothetical protein
MMCSVSRNLGNIDAPLAARAARPGWRDPRLWIGVALVAASVVAGGRLLGGGDHTIAVWVAADDLAEGQPLSEADLAVRRVRFDQDADAQRYLLVGNRLPAHTTLGRAVGGGELVPQSALGARDDGLLEVPIWAPSDAIPASVGPGSTVDVWVTPAAGARSSGARLVLDDVVVIAAPRSDASFSPTGNRQVLVGVRDGDDPGIGLALAAAKDDRVAIIRQG